MIGRGICEKYKSKDEKFILKTDIFRNNYTLYKNPGFWLVNSRFIFCALSYLGLILFIFTTARVFAWGFNFFSLCAVVFVKTYFTFLPSRASNCQIHSDYFFFTFIRKVTWLIKFETWNSKKMSDNNSTPAVKK